MRVKVGIDVGGTFTDFVVMDEQGQSRLFKVLSTPESPAKAVIDGLGKAAATFGSDLPTFLGSVSLIVHGTTITTNAVLTGRLARTALLTTDGFRDLLAMRRGLRETYYYAKVNPPPPVVPRSLIAGMRERVDRDGAVVLPLDETCAREALEQFRRRGVEAVAISLLFSFLNSTHEERLHELCREVLPTCYLSVSSAILPQVRAYERTSTVVLNAAVGPVLSAYLDDLVERLAAAGFRGELRLMQSNGGVVAPRVSQRLAVQTLLSGPAAGPVAGLFYGRQHGLQELMTIDMGGTSFDVSLVHHGRMSLTTAAEVGGHRIAAQSLDIHTVGAGGGSIAWVDGAGVLRVGPASAGAMPGPACYAFGGEKPTVTDADLVLGYLNPERFFGGELLLDAARARAAIAEHTARPLGLTVEEAAWGIYKVVNTTMAMAMRLLSVRRGHDPREFALVVAGGAGPLHAEPLARELNISLIIVPKESALFCGAGMLMADLKHQFVRSMPGRLSEVNVARLNETLAAMTAEGTAMLRTEGVAEARMRLTVSFEMRYEGQFNEVEIDLPHGDAPVTEEELRRVAALFHHRHDALFGYHLPKVPMEVITVRLTAEGMTEKPRFKSLPRRGREATAALIERRQVFFDPTPTLTPVYDGVRLEYGNCLEGPAIIELPTTSIVISPAFQAQVDEYGNFLLLQAGASLDDLLARLRGASR